MRSINLRGIQLIRNAVTVRPVSQRSGKAYRHETGMAIAGGTAKCPVSTADNRQLKPWPAGMKMSNDTVSLKIMNASKMVKCILYTQTGASVVQIGDDQEGLKNMSVKNIEDAMESPNKYLKVDRFFVKENTKVDANTVLNWVETHKQKPVIFVPKNECSKYQDKNSTLCIVGYKTKTE